MLCFCPSFLTVNQKKTVNMPLMYTMPTASGIQTFSKYLFNKCTFTKWINQYTFDVSLSSEMSLTSSEKTENTLPWVFSGIERELENHRRKQNASYSFNLRIFSFLENVGIHVREITILMNFIISKNDVYLVWRQLCSDFPTKE